MRSSSIALITLLVVGAGVGLVLLQEGESGGGPERHEFALRVENQELAEGTSAPRVQKGDTVVFRITADAEEEFHLHGYDRSVDIGPDTEAELAVVANTAGRFPAELEESKTELLVLEVRP